MCADKDKCLCLDCRAHFFGLKATPGTITGALERKNSKRTLFLTYMYDQEQQIN